MARKCSYCKQEGHNILKCPYKTEDEKKQYLEEAEKDAKTVFIKGGLFAGGISGFITVVFNSVFAYLIKTAIEWFFNGKIPDWGEIFNLLIKSINNLSIGSVLIGVVIGIFIGIIGTYWFINQASRERVYFLIQKALDWIGELPDTILNLFHKKENK